MWDAGEIVGHLVSAGSMFAFLAEHRGQLFPDEDYADLFTPGVGRPSLPATRMAAVLTLQALHDLSDRECAEAVRCDLRWKVACGLSLLDEGFDPSTLTYWRRRIATSERPHRINDAIRRVIEATGLLRGRRRRTVDSTIVDDAVATQDTVTQLIGAIRRVRREVVGAPEVIAEHCSAHDYDDPGKPAIAWDDADARERLVDALVSDAHRLLGHLPEAELGPRAAEAVALLALIAGQDVEPVEGSDGTDGRWRIAQRVAPDRVISTVDPDTRHVHKTVARRQDGFKGHLAIEPDTGIITDCALTKATGADNHEAAVGLELLDGEDSPVTVLADSAYGSGEFRAELAERGHTDRVKPAPVPRIIAGGFTVDDFTVDHAAGTATCPNGLTRTISRSGWATFGAACTGCPLRARCTRSRAGKTLRVSAHDARSRAARRAARDPDWLAEYRQHRPMVERTIAWLTRGNRRLRYRGVIKNDHWLHHRAAALNLRRLINLGLGHDGTAWALS